MCKFSVVEQLLKSEYPFKVFEICKIAKVKRHIVYQIADVLSIDLSSRNSRTLESKKTVISKKLEAVPQIVEIVKDCFMMRYPKKRLLKEVLLDLSSISRFLTISFYELMYIIDNFIDKGEKNRYEKYQKSRKKRK